MMFQKLLAYGLGLLALAYIVWRRRSRRRRGTCCGAKSCPAAERILDRL